MIIGFAGKIGVGKTTVAQILRRMLEDKGIPCALFSFSSGLKLEASKKYGFPLEWASSLQGKNRQIDLTGVDAALLPPNCKSLTVREALQYYGTDIIRRQDPNHWVLLLHAILEQVHKVKGTRIAIIDDIRFDNELQYVRRYGVSVRLLPYPEWIPGEMAEHESETTFDGRDLYDGFDLVYAPQYGALRGIAQDIFNRVEQLFHEEIKPTV